MRSVLPPSSSVPLPVIVNGQFGSPGPLATPVIVTGTLFPSTRPFAFPEIVTLPPLMPQRPVNVPPIAAAVWLEIWDWKVPQRPTAGTDGSSFERHVPTSGPVAVGLLFVGREPSIDVGASVLVECSYPQPAVATTAAAARRAERDLLIANL